MNETRIDEPLFLHFVLRNACDTNRLANCLSGSAAKREIKETKNGGKKKKKEKGNPHFVVWIKLTVKSHNCVTP